MDLFEQYLTFFKTIKAIGILQSFKYYIVEMSYENLSYAFFPSQFLFAEFGWKGYGGFSFIYVDIRTVQ